MRDKNRKYKEKTERMSGDQMYYFFLHNIFSSLFFLIVTFCMGIYMEQKEVYGLSGFSLVLYLLSSKFWGMVAQAIVILIFCCIFGRITAYYTIKLYIEYSDRKQKVVRASKRWSEYNVGINRLSIKWFISVCLTAVIFCVGAIVTLSFILFDEATLLPLLTVYVGVKIIVHFVVRWFVGRFL